MSNALSDDRALAAAAEGMLCGRLAKAARALAAQLSAGLTMPEALRKTRGLTRRQRRLLDNAHPVGSVAELLLQLDSYEAAARRIRTGLYSALGYPIILLTGMVAIFSLMGLCVIPQFRAIFTDFKTSLPLPTEWALAWSDGLPDFLFVMAVVVMAFILMWIVLGLFALSRRVRETIVSYFPLWGPLWRASIIVRWCKAVNMAVNAGYSTADAIAWAGRVSRCAQVRAEGLRLALQLRPDRPLDRPLRGRFIDSDISSAIALALVHHDLPNTLQLYATIYENEYQSRRAVLPMLVPLAIGATVLVMFVLVVSMFLPLIRLIQSVSGS